MVRIAPLESLCESFHQIEFSPRIMVHCQWWAIKTAGIHFDNRLIISIHKLSCGTRESLTLTISCSTPLYVSLPHLHNGESNLTRRLILYGLIVIYLIPRFHLWGSFLPKTRFRNFRRRRFNDAVFLRNRYFGENRDFHRMQEAAVGCTQNKLICLPFE